MKSFANDTSLDTIRIIEGAKIEEIKLNTLKNICNVLETSVWKILQELDV